MKPKPVTVLVVTLLLLLGFWIPFGSPSVIEKQNTLPTGLGLGGVITGIIIITYITLTNKKLKKRILRGLV